MFKKGPRTHPTRPDAITNVEETVLACLGIEGVVAELFFILRRVDRLIT
jgi:hypothetical protein